MPLQTELGEESFRLLPEFPGRRTLPWKMLLLFRNRFLWDEGRWRGRALVSVGRTVLRLEIRSFWLNLQ